MAKTEQDQAQSQPSSGDAENTGEDSPVLDTVKEVVTEVGEQATPALAQVLLDALFSDTVREQLLQQAEDGLQELLDSTIEALPDTGAASGLTTELDRTRNQLQSMVREMIDSLFSESTRAEFEQHVKDATRRLTEGDSDGAKDEAELAGKTLLSDMLDVLQDHWGQILRILLTVIAKALQEAIASHIKDAFASIAAGPAHEMQEEVGPLQEQVKERADELRERLAETRDVMQERLEEAKERLQERVAGGISGAVNGGGNGSRGFGRPPSTGPRSAPPGRPPGGRAPAGRPPSLKR
jgi:uncharacterized membrane-anchored protein YjiN (DUF445 family)